MNKRVHIETRDPQCILIRLQITVFKVRLLIRAIIDTELISTRSTCFLQLLYPTHTFNSFFSIPFKATSFMSSSKTLTPRNYQLHLLNAAKQSNIIAVLDTGSGKTLISGLLIKVFCSITTLWK